MKISFFIGSMCRGGAERVISILANAYCKKGWDVEIVLLLNDKVEYTLDDSVRLVSITPKSGGYAKNLFKWFWGIRRYLKTSKPDRVVSFIGRINALVLTAAVGLRIPVVVSERNDPRHDGRGSLMLRYCNRIYRRAKAVVFQNEHERSCFDVSIEHISRIIVNPVTVSAVRKSNDSTTIVTAGRLIDQKNQAMLIRAMEIIHRTHPEVVCRIYGEGALRETLQQQICDLQLQNVVTLEGNVSDIHERLAKCGIFVLTSHFEGLSNALVEAMMVGLPCITTDYPGARELIHHGENGIVVPCDDAQALATAINELLYFENQSAHKLAERAKAFSKRFQTDCVLSQWYDVIE